MRRCFPDFDSFRDAATNADIIPVYRQLLADRLTPVTAFELLGRDEHAFLLERVVGGENIARYSFIATGPALVYQVKDGQSRIDVLDSQAKFKNQKSKTATSSDPLADLQALLPTGRYHLDKNLPAFTGGLVGYAGYDTIRY